MAQDKTTILYVDDDRQAAVIAYEVLSDAGFRLLIATDAEQALQIITAKRVDVLITDIVMPGKNAVELAKKARRLRPRIEVLFVAGDAQKAAQAETHGLGRTLFKPVCGAEIVETIRSLLAV